MSISSPSDGKRGLGPLPIVLGVTGHRDLRTEDIPALEKRVEGIFTEFQERYPQTPLVLLSPLAEGADRLVARVALARGIRLIVPMPMECQEYMRDFETEESCNEFNALRVQADGVIELPLLPGNDANKVCTAEGRVEQYAFVGAYVVRHCQVLIALWNGIYLHSGGGTGEILRFQREGIPEHFRQVLIGSDFASYSLLDLPESKPTYHIVTPRRDHPGLDGEPLTLKKYFPGDDPDDDEDAEAPESEATFDRIYANINAFNLHALMVEESPQLQALQQKNADYLLPQAEAQQLPPDLQALRQRYALADTLTQSFQNRTFQILKILSVIVFVAVLTFELTAKLVPSNALLALIFPVLVGIAWALWYLTVNRGKWQDRYQDYRALAEGLRVEFFWRLAGITTSVSDNYLRK